MYKVYCLTPIDQNCFKLNNIEVKSFQHIDINEERFNALGKSYHLYSLDASQFLSEGEVLAYTLYSYKNRQHTSYQDLIDYMVKHKIKRMSMNVLSSLLVRRENTIDFSNKIIPGFVDIKEYMMNRDSCYLEFEHIFHPLQQKIRLFQKTKSLMDLTQEDKALAYMYSPMFHNCRTLAGNSMSSSTVDDVINFCHSKEKVELDNIY